MGKESTLCKAIVQQGRIRHNQLCAKDTLGREDREQWPAVTVAKAFLEGKIDQFKQYLEHKSGINNQDTKWLKRWNAFVSGLESDQQENLMKKRITSFMSSERINRYRANKSV